MLTSSIFRVAHIVTLCLVPSIFCSRWEADMEWCRDPIRHQLLEGDFNGDRRTDILCHRLDDGYKWIAFADTNGQFDSTGWHQSLGWCSHPGGQILIGDFNGDGKDDLLCHGTTNGYKWIAHANAAGNFADSTTWEQDLGWCFHSAAELYLGDFNGDGKVDMLCHDSHNGHKWISFANADGNFAGSTSWDAPLGWCWHAGAELLIGDFNGDRRDDMLCHDTNGYTWIAYANGEGNFKDNTGWEEAIGWCHQGGDELLVGDVNGDGKDDLVCHDAGEGRKSVALANCGSNFSDGTTWEACLGWCFHAGALFSLGDFNGDSREDMFCHDTNSGYKWVIYSSQPYE